MKNPPKTAVTGRLKTRQHQAPARRSSLFPFSCHAVLLLPSAHPSQSQFHQANASSPGDDGAVDAAMRRGSEWMPPRVQFADLERLVV
ncbi:hypothetical protein B0H13DRAFT_2318102 [Mycena leptocephala]|nr:hypothetical protein B0H13DRAFT_2318102 [Mycena leptocephala]